MTHRILAAVGSEDRVGFVLDEFLPGARIVSVRKSIGFGFDVEVEGERRPVRRQCSERSGRRVTNGTQTWVQVVPCRRKAGESGLCEVHDAARAAASST